MNDKKKPLATCLTILVLAEFISAIILYLDLRPLVVFTQSEHRAKAKHSLFVATSLAASVDTVLALSIVALLHRGRSKTIFSRTSSIIDRIMMYTVGTGLVTAAFAIAGLITSIVMPNNFVYMLILQTLPKRTSVFIS